jgi:hypothetical protein
MRELDLIPEFERMLLENAGMIDNEKFANEIG